MLSDEGSGWGWWVSVDCDAPDLEALSLTREPLDASPLPISVAGGKPDGLAIVLVSALRTGQPIRTGV